ncbi:glycoside hydrolase family 127 protein [Cellulomonas denverensis]|uniref:glycoside hydrolase family 127 protein n=1 Tax=Cellulomonas denverensis TaxID=264297 RepID=UPI0035E50F82
MTPTTTSTTPAGNTGRPHRRTPMSPAVPHRGDRLPLGIDEVLIDGGFWGTRQSVNHEATLEHCLGWLERLGWVANFDATAQGMGGPRNGREFADSEIYKVLEALAWESARTQDPQVEGQYQRLAARVVAAQATDGYLGTRFGGAGQPGRYTDLEWGHELYCAGHLIQAAVARLRTHGEDELVRAALRVADHVVATFGPEGIESVCGHPEIEVALAELSRATGRQEYLHQARLFVERRGHGVLADIELGRDYFQDDIPVRDATVLRGHAVRALYLAAGAVDVAVETGDRELLDALVAQWEATVAARTYVTGGMGSRHTGEAFGLDHELPPDRAYSETCAGVAAVMFSWRLYLATGQMRYADLVERVLYNVIATSPAADGRAFFYANPLHQRVHGAPVDPDGVSPRAASSQRAPWFQVSCCPTNIARTLAGLGGYVAAWHGQELALVQYMAGTIRTTAPDGSPVVLRVSTAYPEHGRVEIQVDQAAAGVALVLRVPSWAQGATAEVDGAALPVTADRVRVPLVAGSTIVLTLPVAPRWTAPDRRVDAVRGCVAVERGPVVLCLESVALPDGTDLHDVAVVPTTEPPRSSAEGGALVRAVRYAGAEADPLDVELRPYHQWGERGPTQMRVWLPQR